MITLEIACNSYNSCLHALHGGAQRIELFENLREGGCTPSYGMIQKVKQTIALPLFVMIRPRGGNFCYTNDELDIMLRDIEVCKQLRVDGIVLGAITAAGNVDAGRCRTLLSAWNHGPATFHRAIDTCNDIMLAAQTVIDLGFNTILTSGGERTAEEGMHIIQLLQHHFGHNINIMAGSGITALNAISILETCKIEYLHASCKTNESIPSSALNKVIQETEQYSDPLSIRALRETIDTRT